MGHAIGFVHVAMWSGMCFLFRDGVSDTVAESDWLLWLM